MDGYVGARRGDARYVQCSTAAARSDGLKNFFVSLLMLKIRDGRDTAELTTSNFSRILVIHTTDATILSR